jgi:hypothetical protein
MFYASALRAGNCYHLTAVYKRFAEYSDSIQSIDCSPKFFSYLAVKGGVVEASACEAGRYVSTLRSMPTWEKDARTPIPTLRREPGMVDKCMKEAWRRV